MLKIPARDKTHWKTKLRRIDFLGAIVLVGAVLGFLVGLDRGSNVSWKLPITIASLSISIALFALFVIVEVYVAAEPFAPGHIIFDRSLFACYACNFFSFGGWLAALFYLPLYFQALDGVSATGAGIRLLPSIVAGVSGSLFGGFVMRWTGNYYWLTVIAYALLTGGLTFIFLFSGAATESLAGMTVGMVMSGFGNGIGVTTTLIGLSKYPSTGFGIHKLTETDSFKCNTRRSGCRDSMLVSFQIAGLSHRPLLVLYSHPATAP